MYVKGRGEEGRLSVRGMEVCEPMQKYSRSHLSKHIGTGGCSDNMGDLEPGNEANFLLYIT